MRDSVRDALDRLAIEVQTDQGQCDLVLIEQELRSFDDLVRWTREVFADTRRDLLDIKAVQEEHRP